jgi:hypothetical protein
MMRAVDTLQDARTLAFRTRGQTQKAQKVLLEIHSLLERTRRKITETEERIATSDELIEYQLSFVCAVSGDSGAKSENVPQGLKPNVYGPLRHD